MSARLQGKSAVVTGAAGGLGSAIARRLASEGVRVLLTDVADGSALAAEIGGLFQRHDVSQESEWASVTALALKEFGGIDILVNAAGIEGDLTQGGLATSYAEFRRVCAINLDGTFLGCMAVMPHMVEAGHGSIINFSSIVSFMGTPSALAYGASKAGVEQLSRSLALIGAENGKRVRVNSIHPGVIATRMTDAIIDTFAASAGIPFAQAEAAINSAVPMRARGEPEDVAAMVAFLASDEAAYVTGSAFRVDGGWSVTSAG